MFQFTPCGCHVFEWEFSVCVKTQICLCSSLQSAISDMLYASRVDVVTLWSRRKVSFCSCNVKTSFCAWLKKKSDEKIKLNSFYTRFSNFFLWHTSEESFLNILTPNFRNSNLLTFWTYSKKTIYTHILKITRTLTC